MELRLPQTQMRGVPVVKAHTGPVTALAYFPDNVHIVSGSRDMTLRIWDRRSASEVQHLMGHKGEVTAVAVSPDGKLVVSGAADATVRLWNADTGKKIRQFDGPTERVVYVAFSGDGSHVFSASADQTLRVWETSSGKEVHRVDLPADHEPLACAAFTTDGSRAYTAGSKSDGTWYEWDVASGEELQRVPTDHRGIRAMALLPDGTRLLTVGNNRRIYSWDLATYEVAVAFHTLSASAQGQAEPPGRPVDVIAVSADGELALTGGPDGLVDLWEVEHGAHLKTYRGHGAGVTSVAFSASRTFLVSGSEDMTIRFWETLHRVFIYSTVERFDERQSPKTETRRPPTKVTLRDVATHKVLAEEAFQPDPVVANEVRRRFREDAPGPIPTEGPASAFRGAWGSHFGQLLADSYRAHGKHDPKWDDVAVRFLADVGAFDAHAPDAASRIALKLQVDNVIGAGCDDPLIRFYYAMLRSDERYSIRLQEAHSAILDSLIGFEDSTYPARIAYRARLNYLLGGQIMTSASYEASRDAPRTAELLAAALVEASRSPLDMRMMAAELWPVLEKNLTSKCNVLFECLAARPEIDPWLVKLLTGRYYLRLGEALRRDAKGRAPVDGGRPVFEQEYARAGVLLSEAWHLHPEWPEAAADMIEVCAGDGAIAGETPRFWFNAAVRAEFDHPAAYRAMLAVKMFPGLEDYRGALDFGSECLETSRFDTEVPRVYERALEEVAAGIGARADLLQSSDALEGLERLYAGYSEATTDNYQRTICDSRHVAVLLLLGRDDDARRQVAELEGRFNAAEIAWFGASPRDFLDRLGISVRDDVASSEFDGEVPEITAQYVFDSETDWGRRVAFSPDGRFGASSHDDESLRVWDLSKGRLVSTSAHDAAKDVSFMQFLPDGSGLIAAGRDGGVRRWGLSNDAQGSPLDAVTGDITALATTPDARTIAAASLDGVWILDSASGKVRFHDPAARAARLAIRRDGRQWAAVTAATAVVRDDREGATIQRLVGHADAILDVAFSPDGNQVLTAGRDKTVRLWDVATGRTLRRLVGHTTAVREIAFADGGRRAVSAGLDQVVCLWDLESGSLLRSFVDYSGFAVAPDGGGLLCIDRLYHTLDLVDAASGQSTARLVGHQHEVRGAAISLDGRTALTASRDGTVRVWNLPAAPERPERYLPREPVAIATPEPNGVLLIGGSQMDNYRPQLMAGDDFASWRDWTVSCDVLRYAAGGSGQIFCWRGGGRGPPAVSLRIEGAMLIAEVASSDASSPSRISVRVGGPVGGTWVPLALRYRAARQQLELFVDGRSVGQVDCEAPPRLDPGQPIQIGDSYPISEPFFGKIRGVWLSN